MQNTTIIEYIYIVGFAAFLALTLEILFAHLVTILFGSQLYYLIFSLAILGIGIGSSSTYFLKNRFTPILQHTLFSFVHWCFLAIFLTTLIALWVQLNFGIHLWWPLTTCLIFLPFFFVGIILGTAFEQLPVSPTILYGIDLLGGCIGVITALLLLHYQGGIQSIRTLLFLAAIIWLLVSFLVKRHRLKTILSGILFIVILFIGRQSYEINYQLLYPEHNSLGMVLQNKYQDADDPPADLLDCGWNEYGRVDIIGNMEDDEYLYAYINCRTPAWMLRFDGDIEQVRQNHENTLIALPMIIRSPKKVLSLGSGAGYDTLLSLAFGAEHVDAVEINPLLLEMVQKWSKYSGKVYNNDKVDLFIEEARNFVRKTDNAYDLICLSLVQTKLFEIYEMGLTENYVYTVEAFQEYLQHLNPNGLIAIWVHDDGLMARAILTGLEALKREGVPYPANTGHIIALRVMNYNESYSFLIMLSRTPFSLKEQETVFMPYSFPEWMPIQVSAVQNIKEAETLLREKIDSGEHPDIKPSSDDRPFFFKVHGLYPEILSILAFAIAIGLILMLVIAFVKGFKPFQGKAQVWKRYTALPMYFALLGIGFMLIEVAIMQRFLLWLGTPVYTFSFLLFSLLAGAGIGSFLSGRIQKEYRTRLILFCTGIIAVFSLSVINHGLPKLFELTSTYSFSMRFVLASICALILGIPMGMPFPVGLAVVRELKLKGIPWAWGINGVASVLGSLLAVLFSQIYGISGIVFLGAGCYIMVGFVFKLCPKNIREG
ncbi:MAG: hypothetical protein ABIF11_04135 [Nitrospirota bacterium]